MPRIGKRILKSSLAVFICFLIYLLRNQEGIVFIPVLPLYYVCSRIHPIPSVWRQTALSVH